MNAPQHISSRENALYKDLRRLSHDGNAYRKQQRVWLEGDHLCRAAQGRGLLPDIAVFAQSSYDPQAWDLGAARLVLLDDSLFSGLSALESPARMAFVLALPRNPEPGAQVSSVILDGLQDAGNVGSILRSAAAFGFRQVIAMRGTVALWSPKVLRAGMGAHFGLQLVEQAQAGMLDGLALSLIATSSHAGQALHEATLPWPCAWVMGHEGQGVSAELAARASHQVRIVQPGGEESLNVAAAAAICMHASAAQRVKVQGINVGLQL